MKTKKSIREEIKKLELAGVTILYLELASKSERYLDALKSIDQTFQKALSERKPKSTISDYQGWYAQAHAVVRQIIPDHLDEFVKQFKHQRVRKEITYENYTIEDYLIRLSITRGGDPLFDTLEAFHFKFERQIEILKSANIMLDSQLSSIRGTLQAELFDDELSAARHLSEKGFLRAAGALAGVTLERHLSLVVEEHKVPIRKKNRTIADYNDGLKDFGTYDIPDWRFIQRLADIRNMCDHDKDREPRDDEIVELLDGVDKIIKTVS